MSEITLSTEVREKAQELVALRTKQAGYFDAIKSAQTPDERSRIKEQAKAGLTEIEAKSADYEGDMDLLRQETSNREALKSMNVPNRTVPFSSNGGGGYDESAFKNVDTRSLGQQLIDSDSFKANIAGVRAQAFNIDLSGISIKSLANVQDDVLNAMKTTMTTGTGWAPYGPRLDGYVESAQRTPSFADLIPQQDTTNAVFYYMEETGFTNNAAYTAEGATKPESAFLLASRTVNVSKIATTLPVSEEQLEDVPQVREYINNRGTLQIALAEENALLNFTAGANGWDGFLVKAGVQVQAKGADPAPTAILKGMTKVQYAPGFAGVATGIAINPTDWLNILTLQESTGAYIWSAPSAPTSMPDMRIWGLTCRPTPALTAGTALLGNFRGYSQIWRRMGLSIRVAYANDDALKNLVRIIFEERLALVISRASAFVTITGL